FRYCIFFSSRRRHTRSYGDWSSDVCSSDLAQARTQKPVEQARPEPVDDGKLREIEERRQELQKALEASEAALRQQRERERAAREELKKARGRAETNNRVYLVTKGELEIVRERL